MEIGRLIAAAERGPVIQGVDGSTRAMAYLVSYATGLRRGELASLTRQSFDLDSDPPTVRVMAAYAKNRRDDDLPLPAAVADRLRGWLGSKGADAPLFPVGSRKTHKMIATDLKVAGIPYVDASGRFGDWHALRHSYVKNLARSGASLAETQALARHSTPTLTAGGLHAPVDPRSLAVSGPP